MPPPGRTGGVADPSDRGAGGVAYRGGVAPRFDEITGRGGVTARETQLFVEVAVAGAIAPRNLALAAAGSDVRTGTEDVAGTLRVPGTGDVALRPGALSSAPGLLQKRVRWPGPQALGPDATPAWPEVPTRFSGAPGCVREGLDTLGGWRGGTTQESDGVDELPFVARAMRGGGSTPGLPHERFKSSAPRW